MGCEKSEPGILEITSEPGDAKVFIDEQRKGTTPAEAGQAFVIEVPEGEHQVTLKIINVKGRDGELCEKISKKTVFIAQGAIQPVHVKLAEKKCKENLDFFKQVENYKKYKDNGDGTVTDTKTGLMWKKCTEGLSGDACDSGTIKKYTWQAAKDHAKGVTFAGYSDWRLPTIKELHTLVYCSKGGRGFALDQNGKSKKVDGVEQNGGCLGNNYARPTINQVLFPNTKSNTYWSTPSYVALPANAWNVFFYDGYAGALTKSFGEFVRLVRGGQSL